MSWHVPELVKEWTELGAWALAIVWCTRAAELLERLPESVDLSEPEWDVAAETELTLTVVVPACNEEEKIGATIEALLAADYARLTIVAIDDRSTDRTGEVLEEYAVRRPDRLQVVHITELPEGWLGKTHAMQVGLEASQSDYVLFTDADVLFSPSILRRAMTYAREEQPDHVVIMPTLVVKSWSEGALLGVFQVLGFWTARPWKVSEAKARDAIGVGACNLVRRAALEELGGLAPQRLAVVEDVTLGHRMKFGCFEQRMVFAPGFILVHWAKGAGGIIRVMTKNLFAVFGFRVPVIVGAMLGLVVGFLLPIAGLAWIRTLLPSLLVLVAIASMYRSLSEYTKIEAKYGWWFPVGAAMIAYAMARSMAVTLWRGGVEWRGTVYPLSELRAGNDLRQWRNEAMERRRRARNVAPSRLRRVVDRWKG